MLKRKLKWHVARSKCKVKEQRSQHCCQTEVNDTYIVFRRGGRHSATTGLLIYANELCGDSE